MAQGGIPSRSPSMEFALECAAIFIHGTLSPPLARSGHSTVYWAISGLFGRPVAVKIINVSALDTSIAKKFLPRELYFTRLVNHPHLSRALAIKMPSPTKIIIVSEFYSGGTLLNLILHDKFISDPCSLIHVTDIDSMNVDDSLVCVYLEQPHASRMFRQLSEAVHYLHIRGVVHRDIKPENVLLDVNGDVKLVDFGFARYISRRERSTSFCGTKPYSAPEILRRKPYDAYAGDWYAMGVLLFTMLTGKWPQDSDLNDNHESKRIAFTTNMTSTEAQALIQSLTDVEPQNRGNYETIVRSDWMRGNNRWLFTDHNYIYEVLD